MYLSFAKLRSFITVGENLSFRVASEKLNLSQPAVSAHVRDLEDYLGVPLLNRTTRSVSLTTEGESFLIRSRRAYNDLENAVLDLKEQASLRRGRLSIGCVPSIASAVLPTVLSQFSERYPDIHIQIYDEMADRLYQRVANSEVDLMVGPISPRRTDLNFVHLFDDRYVVVMPANHQLSGRKSLKICDVAKHPLLLLTSPTNVRIVLEEAFADAGVSFEPVYEAGNPSTIGAMIEGGLGIAALPELMPSIIRPGLVGVPITKPPINRKIGMLTRHGETPSPAAKEFTRTLTDLVATKFGSV